MNSQTTTKPPKRTAKRQAILDSALELFAQRGFHGTAVPLIAEKAKVGAGTIYRHFQSKEDLGNVLFQEWRTKLKDYLESALNPAAPIREQFHYIWTQSVRFAIEHPMAFQFLEMHNHDTYLNEASRTIDREVNDIARDFVVRAKQQITLKEYSNGMLISLVWGALVNMMRMSFLKEFELTEERILQAEICCWEAIRR